MARKWFQLVGEYSNAVTPAAAVYVDVEDVDALRDAVKLKYADSDLAGIAPSNLTVFANRAAYDTKQALPMSSSSVNELGRDEDNAIIIQVPQRSAVLDVRRNLNRVRVQFATGELNYLLAKDTANYNRLELPALTSAEALQIRAIARSAIKSATRNAIGIREGVLLDRPLILSQGQAKSSFYYAYSRFGGILVAKVYFSQVISTGNAENEQRHVIVMPFFARCAADLLMQQSPIELRALITIAHDCFEALCHIHSKKYCFADLKPAKTMLHSGEQGGASLVDFGGAVRLGDPIVEVTDQFCLDVAELQGSELLDWTCLGTTLAQLADIDITEYRSRQDLVRSLKDGHEQVDHLVG
ncbi:unnamed protein product [Phytophthora fragariaefolia]|uniref:Unnamed protein product n=1 Tax=Phytophthora fragariaefolia TaxID=1490495 RepID=A0A9W6YRC7_9STRA|nr:unnamed protein product [Phytophthora fragariaefolia]